MATTFGAMETIHAEAYSLLNEELSQKSPANVFCCKSSISASVLGKSKTHHYICKF